MFSLLDICILHFYVWKWCIWDRYHVWSIFWLFYIQYSAFSCITPNMRAWYKLCKIYPTTQKPVLTVTGVTMKCCMRWGVRCSEPHFSIVTCQYHHHQHFLAATTHNPQSQTWTCSFMIRTNAWRGVRLRTQGRFCTMSKTWKNARKSRS